jgi:hypothetical protein
MSGAERRQHPRLDHNLPLKISADEVDIVTETKNLSCSGAFCMVNRHLEPMSKLKIHLLIPMRKGGKVQNRKISCMGVVIRCQLVDADHFNTAIFFSDITPRDSQLISEFVQHEQSRQR